MTTLCESSRTTTKNEPTRLYTVNDIAEILGVSRAWVFKHRSRTDAPPAEFSVPGRSGKDKAMLLWTANSIRGWKIYHANTLPKSKRPAYSCLNAVNAPNITWKLGWQNLPRGNTRWWFSTPQGWYYSGDDGHTWQATDLMRLLGGFDYFWVNYPAVDSASAAVLRSTEKLRSDIEGES